MSGNIIRVHQYYYLSPECEKLSEILENLREISPEVFDGRVEFHESSGLYSLRIWKVTNRWVLDEEVRKQKDAGEGFLEEVRGISPVGITHGSFDDFPEMGDPDIVAEKDPDGAYGIEIYIDENSIKVLSYDCDITSGVGEWTIETFRITTEEE